MKKGSLTVFFALIMVTVMTLMFSLAELVRINALITWADSVTEAAAECGFSEFNPYLWEKYRVLGLDLAYGGQEFGTSQFRARLANYASMNTSENLYVTGAKISNYGLFTDNGGNGVIYEGVRDTKESLLTEIIDDIRAENNIIDMTEKDPQEDINNGKASAEAAAKANEDKRKQAEEAGEELEPGTYCEPESIEDNPLDAYSRIKDMLSKGVVAVMVSDYDSVSKETVDLDTLPSHRKLRNGTLDKPMEVGVTDKVMYGQYLISRLNYYGKNLEHDGLKYEIEYVIAGKETDTENLAAVCNKLLLVREGINVACIMSNPGMYGKAVSMANALTGANPALAPAVTVAIVAAWAYVESVLEVRTLLAGGKIAIVKTQQNWNSDIAHLSNFLGTNKRAANVENGISYSMYLRSFVAVTDFEKLGLRTCDIYENALSTQEKYKKVKLDNMIFKSDIDITYAGKEIFYSLLSPSKETIDGYEIRKKTTICY